MGWDAQVLTDMLAMRCRCFGTDEKRGGDLANRIARSEHPSHIKHLRTHFITGRDSAYRIVRAQSLDDLPRR